MRCQMTFTCGIHDPHEPKIVNTGDAWLDASWLLNLVVVLRDRLSFVEIDGNFEVVSRLLFGLKRHLPARR